MSEGDRVTIATVPDLATAELLREVLSDGGIPEVDIRVTTGMAYMPRSTAVEHEVRVDEDDELRARQVLRDFEETSGQAATSQAADSIAREADEPEAPMRARRPWVFWVALVIALVFALPILFSALTVAAHFVRELLAGS